MSLARIVYVLAFCLLSLPGCRPAPGDTQTPTPAEPSAEAQDGDAAAADDPAVPPEPSVPPKPASDPQEPPVADEPPPPDPSAVAEAPAERGPLDDRQVEILWASPQDKAAEHRGGVTKEQENRHYLAGNEWSLEIYYPILNELRGGGGGYVGVGTDQAYLFMSWMRPEIAWFIDYDPAVQEIHELYRVFFAHAKTPEEFITLWDKPSRDAAIEVIMAAHEGRRAKALRRWYLGYRTWIHRRLRRVARSMKKADVPSYLTDQEHYEFVQQMLEQRRVRPLLVNLLESKGLRGVGKAANELGVPIRMLYLSNAEEYWPRYPKRYREIMAQLPFAGDALLVRTLLIWSVNHDYRYNVQPISNYVEWLAKPYIDDVYDITHARPKADPEIVNFFETNADPEKSPSARRYRKAKEREAADK